MKIFEKTSGGTKFVYAAQSKTNAEYMVEQLKKLSPKRKFFCGGK